MMPLVNLQIKGVCFSEEREGENDEGEVCIQDILGKYKNKKGSVLVNMGTENSNCLKGVYQH